jgi:hypothetical protein
MFPAYIGPGAGFAFLGSFLTLLLALLAGAASLLIWPFRMAWSLLRRRRRGSVKKAILPVAWSTFATGVNPAKHNIFDFLNRDLRTYAPELSSAKVLRKSVEMRRKSEPFWKILGRNAVSSTILRVPITFPPDEFNGRLLSAMCTPDLRGTQGTFSRFTDPAGELIGPNSETIPFRVA